MTEQAARIPVPDLSVPKVQKAAPAPFARPRIDLDGGRRIKREWRPVLACDIKEGDIIAELGQVTKVDQVVAGNGGALSWTVTVHAGLDNVRVYNGETSVFAFSAVADAK